MNSYLRVCVLLLLSLCSSVFAAPLALNGDYWQCTTSDASSKQWSAISIYQKISLNFAYALCKKESTVPATCRATKDNCEQFVRGVSIKPMWQCTALDMTAVPWRSNPYAQRDDAALAAKAYCRQKSVVPGTCYVNMVTCVNRNGFN